LTEAARPSGLAVAELPVQLSGFVARERELSKPSTLAITAATPIGDVHSIGKPSLWT